MATNFNESILLSVKKVCNIAPDDTSFDLDVVQAINTAFSILAQLGVGPSEGFAISGSDEVWNDFVPDDMFTLRMCRTCVECRVRLIFDPPSSGAHMESLKQTIKELEWRLNVESETTPTKSYVCPFPEEGDDFDFLKYQ